MNALSGKTVAVAGGTGNVGSFIVRGLLKEGARVAVPSRSEEKIESLRNHIRNTDGSDPDRLYTITGNLSNEKDAARILNKITRPGRSSRCCRIFAWAFYTGSLFVER
ncbi:MAG: SDR family NAD(P)-dependent oxidoreductase [Balneolaceae bacterium]